MAQEELQKLLKNKEAKKASMSAPAAQKLQAEISSASINVLLAYGT